MTIKFKGEFIIAPDKESRSLLTIGVSGNARQRRKIVRRWKVKGYAVFQWDIQNTTPWKKHYR